MNQLAEELLTLSDRIAKEQVSVLDLTENVQETSDLILKYEGSLRLKISNETDDSGKKKYPNADSREAAFLEIASTDFDLIGFRAQLKNFTHQLGEAKIECDRLRDHQRNLRTVINFMSTDHL